MEPSIIGQVAAPAVGSKSPKADIFTANEESFDVNEKKTFNFGVFICWIAALIAISGSIFFWLLNKSTLDALAEKNIEKDQIISEINSPGLIGAEQKATLFKKAVSTYESVTSQNYPMSVFLPALYQKVSPNVVIKNVSVTADSVMSFDGQADSYHSVALQLLLLKDWKVNDKSILKDVKLLSVSENINETSKKVEAPFSISAKIVKSASLNEKTGTANSQSSSESISTSDDLIENGGDDEASN